MCRSLSFGEGTGRAEASMRRARRASWLCSAVAWIRLERRAVRRALRLCARIHKTNGPELRRRGVVLQRRGVGVVRSEAPRSSGRIASTVEPLYDY